MSSLDFYFDFISPYAYLGWKQVQPFAGSRALALEPRPVLFAAILGHFGQLGPAEIAPKRVFTFKDVVRRAAEYGVPLNAPAGHPFNPLLLLRIADASKDRAVIDACFDLVWVRGVEPSDAQAVAADLSAQGFEGEALVAMAGTNDAKAAVREQSDEAIALGVFGVPTIRVCDELVFGHDRLKDVAAILDDADAAADLVWPDALRPLATRKR